MRNPFLITTAAALTTALLAFAASPALASGNGSGPDESFPPNGVVVIGSTQPAISTPAANFNALYDRGAPAPASAHSCGSVAVHGQQGGVSYEDRCW